MTNVSLKSEPMRNHHDILMSSGKYSQEKNLSSLNGDVDVPGILSDMLTKSQGHKENDDKVREDVEVYATIVKDGGMNNPDQALIKE